MSHFSITDKTNKARTYYIWNDHRKRRDYVYVYCDSNSINDETNASDNTQYHEQIRRKCWIFFQYTFFYQWVIHACQRNRPDISENVGDKHFVTYTKEQQPYNKLILVKPQLIFPNVSMTVTVCIFYAD